MKKTYNKLVRDNVPEIIQAEGRSASVKTLTDVEFAKALKEKLIEEAQEVLQAGDDKAEIIKELGDVQEVVDAMLTNYKITKEEADAVREKRRRERGGFEKKILLEYIEE